MEENEKYGRKRKKNTRKGEDEERIVEKKKKGRRAENHKLVKSGRKRYFRLRKIRKKTHK